MPICSAVLDIPFHTEWNYGGDTVFLLKYFTNNLRERVGICLWYFTTITLILISYSMVEIHLLQAMSHSMVL
jgi:hypothetical protein